MNDIFEKTTAAEPSEGATEQPKVEQPSQGEVQEKLPPKKQEGTFENLQSQKDKLEKQLREKEAAWEQEKRDLLNKAETFEEQLQRINRDLDTIKNPPPKPVELKPPVQPTVNFEDDPVQWFKYQNDLLTYTNQKNELEAKSLKAEVTEVKTQLQQEAEKKLNQQKYDLWRADLIGEFEKEGLSHEDAVQCFNRYSSNDSVTPKNIVSLFRLSSGQPIETNMPEKERFPLPGGRGGTANVKSSDGENLINSMGQNKYSNIFDKK
jgi:molecular chaperone GrpE (heat shock protein)